MSETIPVIEIDKSTWERGPWDNEPDRVEFVHAGFACLALRHPRNGNWCGYVGVPREHPAYACDPFSLDVDVHQGTNYGGTCDGLICHVPEPGMPADVFWIGFDCGHAFDWCPGQEARSLARGMTPWPPELRRLETYRALPYVRHEVERLAEQLAAMQAKASEPNPQSAR